MVGGTGIEPVTSAVSRQRSPAELTARDAGVAIAALPEPRKEIATGNDGSVARRPAGA